MNTPEIETPRCTLRLLGPHNAELLHAYRTRNQDHLAPWERNTAQQDGSSTEACDLVAQRAWQGFMDGASVQFMAVEHGSQRMLAACNFTNIVRGPLQACHLGYSVDQQHQGKGLMHEVASAGIHYMFHSVCLHRIMANHMPTNTRSERLLRALGFEREGYARAYLKIAGQWEDMVLNALVNPQV